MWGYKFVLFRCFKVRPFIPSLTGGVQWSLNEVVFRGSNPSRGQREERKKACGTLLCLGCLICWWAALIWPWTLEDLALIQLCAGCHLSATFWHFLTNNCLVVKAQSISANSLNLYQALPLIPKVYIGVVWENTGRLHCVFSCFVPFTKSRERHPSIHLSIGPITLAHPHPFVPPLGRVLPCPRLCLYLIHSCLSSLFHLICPFLPLCPLGGGGVFVILAQIWVSGWGSPPFFLLSYPFFSIHPSRGNSLCVIFLANRFRASH